jgi:MAPEG family protein
MAPNTPVRAPFLRRQLIALVQIALVWLICGLAFVYGVPIAPRPETSDLPDRILFVAQWLLVPGVTLLICIIVTMSTRFVSQDAFDGMRAPASRFTEINLRVTQNTLEQVVLVVIAWGGLALALPAERLGVIPVLAALFAVGRLLFWAGYQIDPIARAVGFGLTAVAIAVARLWLAWRAA